MSTIGTPKRIIIVPEPIRAPIFTPPAKSPEPEKVPVLVQPRKESNG